MGIGYILDVLSRMVFRVFRRSRIGCEESLVCCCFCWVGFGVLGFFDFVGRKVLCGFFWYRDISEGGIVGVRG